MEPGDVLRVLDVLQERGLQVWLDGGWGVDALLGEVTRQHEDVDLVVELEAVPDVLDCLGTLGLAVVDDLRPVRVVVRAPDGRQVDLHPVTFADDGTGWQLGASADGTACPYPPWGFGQGHVLGRAVPCLTPELQLEHHCGYQPRARDRSDMAKLAQRFALTLLRPY
jgi:lincosamide nucleotidyltransferase A/C/D/E